MLEKFWRKNLAHFKTWHIISPRVHVQFFLFYQRATVAYIESKPKSKWRPFPLETVEMEKKARMLRMSAKRLMEVAEKLYIQGFISYPRTETNIFPKSLALAPLIETQTNDHRIGEFSKLNSRL